MSEKPDYNELEQRVKELEKEISELKNCKDVQTSGSYHDKYTNTTSYAETDLQAESFSRDHFANALINSLPGVYYLIDRKGKLHRWNNKLERVSGYSSKELANMQASDFFNESDWNEVETAITRAFEAGHAYLEVKLVTRSGVQLPHFFTGTRVELDGDIYLNGIAVDITERKQIEEALIKAKREWEMTFDAIPDIISVQDADMRVIRANNAAHEFFQVEPGELNGKFCYEIFREAAEPCKGCPILSTLSDHTPHEKDIIHENLGRTFNVTSSSILDENGEFQCLVHIAKDITEQKRLESLLLQEQKIESLSGLAGGIAHDFNNILMGLFGNITLAKLELDSDHPAFKSLEEAEISMNRATRLSRQLLTFARGGEPIRKDASMNQLVEETVRFDLSGSNVKPIYNLAEDLWLAEVDKGQIQQVFSNLTLNAAQAMPDGGHLYITMENAEITDTRIPKLEPGKYIRITVADEGAGIDRKHLDRIFDPYFTTKSTGRGLGLATSYSIIKKHGGSISVDSERGKGTKFTLYLPASPSKPAAPEAETVETENYVIKQNARILVMDDEEAVRDVSEKMLSKNGFIVNTAAHGEEAIEKYRQSIAAGEPFDVVIMDLTIPGGMGGKESVKEILQIDPEARVIISSGYTDDPVMANYAEYGFQGVIEKPLEMNQLVDLLQRILKEEQME